MRHAVRKALVACFRREFEGRFPQFKQITPKSDTPTWAWEFAPSLTFFVLVEPLEKYDRFVIEVAWNENCEFPWGGLTQLSKIHEHRGRLRLSSLWRIGNPEPIWDVAPEATSAVNANLEALGRGVYEPLPPEPAIDLVVSRIGPLVEDAVQKLAQFGLPLFRRVADIQGITPAG